MLRSSKKKNKKKTKRKREQGAFYYRNAMHAAFGPTRRKRAFSFFLSLSLFHSFLFFIPRSPPSIHSSHSPSLSLSLTPSLPHSLHSLSHSLIHYTLSLLSLHSFALLSLSHSLSPFRPWRTSAPNDLQVNGPYLQSPFLLLPVHPRHGYSPAPPSMSLYTGHIILSQDLLPLQAQIQPRRQQQQQQQHQVNTSTLSKTATTTTTTLTTPTPPISTAT